MQKEELPFEIERACRCSFVVRFSNGERAFITNANLLVFLNHPATSYQIVRSFDKRGIEMRWVAVYTLDFGFKRPLFSATGERL